MLEYVDENVRDLLEVRAPMRTWSWAEEELAIVQVLTQIVPLVDWKLFKTLDGLGFELENTLVWLAQCKGFHAFELRYMPLGCLLCLLAGTFSHESIHLVSNKHGSSWLLAYLHSKFYFLWRAIRNKIYDAFKDANAKDQKG